MILAHFGDAAFAANLDGTSFDGVFGYLRAPNDLHTWTADDWKRFPGWKVPIWVGGQDGPGEGRAAVTQLQALGVPKGCIIVLDMEGRKDDLYVMRFGRVVQAAGYLAWVYGSASTDRLNPPLNGYWLAEYGPGGAPLSTAQVMALLELPHVRGVQYASNRLYDSSLIKKWTEGEMWQ